MREKNQITFTLISIFALLGLFSLQVHLRDQIVKPPFVVSKQNSSLNLDNELLKIFNLGQSRLISSVLWIHTLMESDTEHYKKKDLNSWIYLRFNSIVTLEPDFYKAYLYAGQYLSIVKDDIYGARDILDRGIKKFPDDFWLNFHAGFNYYFELGDVENAIIHYGRILDDPLMTLHAPYLPSIYAKLNYDEDNPEAAYLLMKTAYEQLPEDNILRTRFYDNLYSIRAEVDLKCLNNNQTNCSLVDLDGNPYIKDSDGSYKSAKTYRKFRLNVRRKDNWENKAK